LINRKRQGRSLTDEELDELEKLQAEDEQSKKQELSNEKVVVDGEGVAVTAKGPHEEHKQEERYFVEVSACEASHGW
jgi:hypothetical protein